MERLRGAREALKGVGGADPLGNGRKRPEGARSPLGVLEAGPMVGREESYKRRREWSVLPWGARFLKASGDPYPNSPLPGRI